MNWLRLVCAVLVPLCLACDSKDEVKSTIINADDSRIYYEGRKSETPLGIAMAWSGSTVHLKFKGTHLWVDAHDQSRPGTHTANLFTILVDGKLHKQMQNISGKEIPLATGLKDTVHTVSIIKESEASVGKIEYLSFKVKGELFAYQPDFSHKLLFIGNSITTGFGTGTSTTEPEKTFFSTQTQIQTKAYPYLTAKKLNAEYHTIAYSGKGIYRSYEGSTTGQLPALFYKLFPEGDKPFQTGSFRPDAIVINLGTNDFNPKYGIPAKEKFVGAYEEFLVTLTKNYPNAAIILLTGPMVSNEFPAGGHYLDSLRFYVGQVQEKMEDKGVGVSVLHFEPQQPPYGDLWHPSAATHAKMSEKLTKVLQEKLY